MNLHDLHGYFMGIRGRNRVETLWKWFTLQAAPCGFFCVFKSPLYRFGNIVAIIMVSPANQLTFSVLFGFSLVRLGKRISLYKTVNFTLKILLKFRVWIRYSLDSIQNLNFKLFALWSTEKRCSMKRIGDAGVRDSSYSSYNSSWWSLTPSS